jgi:hypothetical protein
MGLLLSSGKAWAAYWVWATKDGLKPIKPRFLYSVFVNGTVEEWNGTIYEAHLISKKLFLKLTPFLFFTLNQSFLSLFKLKKLLQNKNFYFFFLHEIFTFLYKAFFFFSRMFHFQIPYYSPS